MSSKREGILLAFLFILAGLFHFYDKDLAIEACKKEMEQEVQLVITRTERATEALEASTREEIKARDEKINRISAMRDAAIRSLHNRPSRDDPDSKTGRTCTGSELSREDAEFLTREAARANVIAEERDSYWRQYERVRKEMEKLNGEIP